MDFKGSARGVGLGTYFWDLGRPKRGVGESFLGSGRPVFGCPKGVFRVSRRQNGGF